MLSAQPREFRSKKLAVARLGLAVLCTAAITTALPAAKNTKLSIGSPGPTWKLRGTDGKEHSSDDLKDANVIVVVFTCHSCPVSTAYEQRVMKLAEAFKSQHVAFVAINPNKTTNLREMSSYATQRRLPFPYLCDATQTVAKSFGARLTPEVFVLNKERNIAYLGAIDDDVSLTGKPRKNYLRDAIEAALSGGQLANSATQAFGCRINWK